MFSSNTSQVASSSANYVEDVFATYLYTGTGASQTITNNIDTTTYGGLVWIKGRSGATGHRFTDTARGTTKSLESNSTAAEVTESTGLTAFGTTGFTIGADADYNTNAATYTSWTFRKQAKFFDVVTYTGNGANRTIAHNLGSVPGCIIVKRTDTTGDWQVYHRSLANTEYLVLNTTAAKATGATRWNSTTPTSTEFSLGTDATVNANGGTYVAYLFAHNAGGFGTTGTDNVISCGGVTLDSGGGNTTVNLGYEPQWILARPSNQLSHWTMFDNMRGWAVGGSQQRLRANLSNTEDTQTNWINITSTGFVISSSFSNPSDDVIYIAIRRGPMKTPTSGTSVYQALSFSSSASNQTIDPGITTDLCLLNFTNITNGFEWFDRLRGITGTTASGNKMLFSPSTAAEVNSTDINGAGQTTLVAGGTLGGYTQIVECFRRAPSFFDEVCYTGTGSATTIAHNLGVAPELIIVKRRDTTGAWDTYSAALSNTEYIVLNTTAAKATGASRWNSTTPTSSVFSIGTSTTVNASGGTYVAYLFATCTGVSKVGSYTGTGTTLQIDCGFTGGARFVLIKKTSGTGSWYVWDSARGIVSGNDPYLLLNSTAAEVTNTDYVDTYSAGFEISSTAPSEINENGGTFIFFAVS